MYFMYDKHKGVAGFLFYGNFFWLSPVISYNNLIRLSFEVLFILKQPFQYIFLNCL